MGGVYILKVNKIDLLPLKAITLYVSIGLTLSFFGPIKYDNYEQLPVAIYIISFLFLFNFGYILGLIKEKPSPSKSLIQERYKLKKILFWVKVSIIIITLVQLITLVTGIIDGSLNLSISKMGEAYINTYKDYERGTGNISITFLVQTLTYIPYLTALILGVFYFKYLPRKYRWLIVFIYISIFFIETVGHGKQKQLGDMFVFLVLVSLLKVNIFNKKIRKKILRKILFFGVIGTSFLVMVLYFRYTALGTSTENINSKVTVAMQYNLDSIIFKIFGDEIGFPIAVFTGYLSQGYYGLSLAMQQPFQWTYLVGNSYSMTVFLNRFLDIPVDFHDTYAYRTAMHTSWDESKWFSVFTWFAGDITFTGTLFLFMLIAYLYGKVWREAYKYKNPISIILFANLTIGLLYIPSNNQLLHTPGSIIAMFYFISIWILKHKKFNFYSWNNNPFPHR
jgi:hypothetical protein